MMATQRVGAGEGIEPPTWLGELPFWSDCLSIDRDAGTRYDARP
jgi:hypothetical protein